MTIIDKISKAKLTGRGGACFPVATKWEAVKNAPGATKYVICNAAEGEPGIRKDGFILDKYPIQLIDGMNLAIKYLGAKEGIIYINPLYFEKFHRKIKKLIASAPIKFFPKPHNAGYIGGEESSILNSIEGHRIEPRLRPPFPTEHGLYGCPTLINNVETFYNVSLVNSGDYRNDRFYTLGGDCAHRGVICLPESWTIEHILKQTKNYPRDPFFVQVGGDASGIVYNESQLRNVVSGAGSITVYIVAKHKPTEMLKKWLNFFADESCGQCTTCREGTYRLKKMVNSGTVDWEMFALLLRNLESNSFCGLGAAVSIPIRSYVLNVLPRVISDDKSLNNIDIKTIKNYFK